MDKRRIFSIYSRYLNALRDADNIHTQGSLKALQDEVENTITKTIILPLELS